MSKLLALRGISGSGKSTYAEALRREGWVVVSRDHLREMFKDYASVDENMVTAVQDAAIEEALKAGRNTVVDDTNIRLKYLKRFAQLAAKHGATFEVKEFSLDLNTALLRVASRAAAGGRGVPGEVIKKQHQALKSSKLDWNAIYEPVWVPAPYVPPIAGMPAIIADVDGTLAHNNGHRGWYDYSKVYGDEVKPEVAGIVRAMSHLGFDVIIMSGRDDVCMDETTRWLDDNFIPWDSIFMRKTGDMRKDNIVKAELFDAHVRDNYRIEFVLDDRDQVVQMWRAMGLTCLQVAPGDF